MPTRAGWLVLGSLLVASSIGACGFATAPGRADLPATLSLRDVSGGVVAFQSGLPVPTFDPQPRFRQNLDGAWKFEPQALDSDLSLDDRDRTLKPITRELGMRAGLTFNDASWSSLAVPGTFDPPPVRSVTGGYYRRVFLAVAGWAGSYATLKFGAVRYVADVWLNGTYLGYHEGGDTPFALDATKALLPGTLNTLLVRVDNPAWGTRNDIVPWGLADWWNYGGIVGDVWLEATPALSAVRADVVPHLDGADVSVVVEHRGSVAANAAIDVALFPAQVTASNLADPDPLSLIPRDATPLLERHIDIGNLGEDAVVRIEAPFAIRGRDLWSPSTPSLYVLGVAVDDGGTPVDHLYTSFGLRQVKVDSHAPRVLLNGDPIAFNGVALHEEREQPAHAGRPAGGQLDAAAEIEAMLKRVLRVHADFARIDHHPPNQLFPVLADRLGVALWEEIPLYHYTPETFSIAMDRGLAQQMLVEMDLRDFNRPSVLFHGFANESTGGAERKAALDTLNALDRRIDGTRLTGQAAYGTDPADPTSAGLDVAGYTFYYGVLYGGRLSAPDIQTALMRAHNAYPDKPLMILEFGHWADDPADETRQLRVFNVTYSQLSAQFDVHPRGFIAAATWWSLDDYWTQRPGIEVETFGLFRPDGSLRPAGAAAARAYAITGPPAPVVGGQSSGIAVAIQPSERHGRLLGYIAAGVALPALFLLAVIVVLSWRPRSAC